MHRQVLVFTMLVILLTLSKSILYSQDLNYTHYTMESGLLLPSNEVYGIVFDQNKVLWAITDRGVWRYDGYNGRQFTVSDGLGENSNLRIFKSLTGSIWVSSMNNQLHHIMGDSVYPYPMNERIHEIAKSNGFIQNVTEKPDSSIYLCFNRPDLFYFKPGERPVQLTDQRRNHTGASLAIHYKPDEFYWDMIGYPHTDETIVSQAEPEGEWIYLTLGLKDPKYSYRKDLYPINKDEFLFIYSHRAFYIKNGHIKEEIKFQKDILSVFVDKKGNFWMGLDEGEGVIRFPQGSFKSSPEYYLQGESVSGIAQDHEGNYWFATTTNGIFEANTLDISIFKIASSDTKDNIITSMVSDGDYIYLGTQTGRLFKGSERDNRRYFFNEIPLPPVSGPIRKLIHTPENHLIVFKSSLMEIDTLGTYRGVKKILGYPFDYVRKPDGEWMASFTDTMEIIRKGRVLKRINTSAYGSKDLMPDGIPARMTRIRCMLLDSLGRIWMGSQSSGLYSTTDSVNFPWSKKNSLFARRTHDIIQAGKNIWVSIADYGLAVIQPDSTITRITQKDGLSSDIIDVLFAENEYVVWAGTNNGLNRITLQKDASGIKIENISYYTISEGLPSNRIFQIIKHKGNIWIATTQGAIRLNPEFTKPLEIAPQLEPGPLLVNGIPRELDSLIRLKPRENDLVFKFKAITYRMPRPLKYQYKLDGVDAGYIITTNLEARYPNRTHGKYVFHVNASYNGDFDPANEKIYYMEIRKHWYETKLLFALYGLILLGIGLLGFRMILRMTQRREFEKRQLLQAEKRSLLSQMNPHFIFNSLNSIQHFIIQHDEVQANIYLTNFSGLIRRILENSKKNLIPLHEEITTLSLYLSMEKLRFESDFEYQILKEGGIDYNETMIPPMLIQPFVENAIWHGLLPLKTKGILTISFIDQHDFFQVSIEDNGIGREKAMTLKGKKPNHLSSGIRNIEERIELLNKMNNKKIFLKISDLNRSDGTAAGTLVELFLPVDLKI